MFRVELNNWLMAVACVLRVKLNNCLPVRMRASKFWRLAENTVTLCEKRVAMSQ